MDKAKKAFITNCLMAGKDDWYANERQGCYVIGRNNRSCWAVKFDNHIARVMNMDPDTDSGFVAMDYELLLQRGVSFAR